MESLFKNQTPQQLRTEHLTNQQPLLRGSENIDMLKKLQLNSNSKYFSSTNFPPMLQKIFANSSSVSEQSSLVGLLKLKKIIFYFIIFWC